MQALFNCRAFENEAKQSKLLCINSVSGVLGRKRVDLWLIYFIEEKKGGQNNCSCIKVSGPPRISGFDAEIKRIR